MIVIVSLLKLEMYKKSINFFPERQAPAPPAGGPPGAPPGGPPGAPTGGPPGLNQGFPPGPPPFPKNCTRNATTTG